ncbi:FAD/NAD(P)-binding oxidoreductase [Photorhabdus sp. HUG-39]|uniref:FAD-binding protein n=1 Tax=Photorhabdus kayaii TaxID=230088 RepID=A0ABX0ASD0_9GAMM|nr:MULTISPECIES: FAD-dependent oxidoreductase [Photorhabdus]MCC8375521.1 FAD-dependent oxidoreductase [Photorhabdus bodei]NDL10448.1 FAD-binding protein [Photorhabdus kayaii]NDL23677.1 FAD-binding protein [Photorhabdus kayaii]RAX12295.1 FAD/NAD(P)-binding oxidoreductase [Photorhabdus sp. HUG-39]
MATPSFSTILHCDVLVVGAGPAGLATAQAAIQGQQSVILIDDNPKAGGQIWRQGPFHTLPPMAKHYLSVLSEDALIYLPSCKVIAVDSQCVMVETASRHRIVHYQRIILCTGAKEKLLPFPGWTLPGVTGAGGLQALIKSGLPMIGERVVIAGSGPLLLAVAETVKKAGGNVVGIIEQAPLHRLFSFGLRLLRWPNKLHQAIALMPLKNYYKNSMVLGVETSTEGTLTGVYISNKGQKRKLPCTRLAFGFGLRPNTELAQLLGCLLDEQRNIQVDAWQQTTMPGVYAAGECTGIGGSELALCEGFIAGFAASGKYALAEKWQQKRRKWRCFATAIAQTFKLNREITQALPPDTLICRCEDISLNELEPFQDWNSAKMATRCGMGACQGKICSAILHDIKHWAIPSPRIPLSPTRLETLAAGDTEKFV